MRFLIYQNSRRGARKNNEDRLGYSYSKESLLMVVADGMGGHLHGEIAAEIAVQSIIQAFQREAQPKLADPHRFLIDTITRAHLAILSLADARQLPETPRTTCVVCIVQDGAAYWAHVGDSRLYLIRDGLVEAVTKDHSRVQLLVDAGRLRPEEMLVHPERNKIFNCLGQLHPPRVDVSRKTALNHGDTIYLCSDGFWGPLPPALVVDTLSRKDILKAVPELLDAALERAGNEGDNASIVAMTWHDAALSADGLATRELAEGKHETRLPLAGVNAGVDANSDLTDEDIRRAINEIRSVAEKVQR
jgi:PPM family protein phosphatase